MAVVTCLAVYADLERPGDHLELTAAAATSALLAPYAGSLLLAGQRWLLRVAGAGLGLVAVALSLQLGVHIALEGGTAACRSDDCGIEYGIVAGVVLMPAGLVTAVVFAALHAMTRPRPSPP